MKYLFLSILFCCSTSFAIDLYNSDTDKNCQSGSGVGSGACMRAAYEHYQKQINQLIDILSNRLESEHKNLVTELRVSQRIWMLYVKSACEVEVPYFEGTMYAATIIGCEVNFQEDRIKYLEKVLENARQY